MRWLRGVQDIAVRRNVAVEEMRRTKERGGRRSGALLEPPAPVELRALVRGAAGQWAVHAQRSQK